MSEISAQLSFCLWPDNSPYSRAEALVITMAYGLGLNPWVFCWTQNAQQCQSLDEELWSTKWAFLPHSVGAVEPQLRQINLSPQWLDGHGAQLIVNASEQAMPLELLGLEAAASQADSCESMTDTPKPQQASVKGDHHSSVRSSHYIELVTTDCKALLRERFKHYQSLGLKINTLAVDVDLLQSYALNPYPVSPPHTMKA